MAIVFYTTDPSRLLNAYKQAIKEGHVETWTIDTDGDFRHTPDQWMNVAWLKPTIYSGQNLTMNFIGHPHVVTTRPIYAVFHGRFIESMLSHCDSLFSHASASAMATNADLLTSRAA